MRRSHASRSHVSAQPRPASFRPNVEVLEDRCLPGSMLTALAGSVLISGAAGVRIIPVSSDEGTGNTASAGRAEAIERPTALPAANTPTQARERQAADGVGRTVAVGRNPGSGDQRPADTGAYGGKAAAATGLADLEARLPDPVSERGLEGPAAAVGPDIPEGQWAPEGSGSLVLAPMAAFELGGSVAAPPMAGVRANATDQGLTLTSAGNADGKAEWTALLSFLATGTLGSAGPASVSANPPGGKSGDTPPPPDPGPQAIDQQATTDGNQPVNIYWLTYGDTDPNGDRLTLTGLTPPASGTIGLNADGTVRYTPAVNWFGTDTFTYTVSNSSGETATANVNVTVNHVKPPPTAQSLHLTTDQNTPISVPLSGTDVEGAALSYFIEDDPTNGTLSAVGDDNTVTYVPNGNFHGTDTFTYKATDDVLAGPAATVTITVNPVAQGPGVTITQLGGSTQVSQFVSPPDGVNAAEYTIVLNTQPAANVVITPNPDSQLSVAPAALTFTPNDWSVPQTITVSALDDHVANPEPDTAVIAHTATSTDSNYNGVAISSVSVSVVQANFPGIYFSPQSDPIVLDERGQTSAVYAARLSSKPAANVTVTLAGGSRVMLSPGTLVFTPDNWDTPQAVTVQAIHDGIPEGYQEVDVHHTASSLNPMYQGVDATLPLHIIDADNPNAVPPDDA